MYVVGGTVCMSPWTESRQQSPDRQVMTCTCPTQMREDHPNTILLREKYQAVNQKLNTPRICHSPRPHPPLREAGGLDYNCVMAELHGAAATCDTDER